MKKLFLGFIIFYNASFAITAEEAYSKAQAYEKEGNTKEALYWYKKAAGINISKNIGCTTLQKKELQMYEKKKDILFAFEPYKTNYILPVTYNSVSHKDRKSTETKFQISIKKKLASNLLGFKNRLYFGYTQQSYWQTSEKSTPFRETNYAPEFFLVIPYMDGKTLLKRYKIGLLHQSNGRDGLVSRSWNRVYLQGFLQYGHFSVIPRVWYRIPERKKRYPLDANGDDNPDIWNYLGYGDLKIKFSYKQQLFSLTLRDNFRFDHNNKGSVEFNWSFPLIKNSLYIYLQAFSGYGESLIDYNRRNNKIGIGFAISR
jgi:phospholipase A1